MKEFKLTSKAIKAALMGCYNVPVQLVSSPGVHKIVKSKKQKTCHIWIVRA